MTKQPLVLCLTNTVAANFTANCLLAIGAKPAMIEEPSEAAELVTIADAMLVNLGTVTPVQAETIRTAVAKGSVPWVLDPVACHLLSFRRQLAVDLIQQKPSLIRGNHAEISFLIDYCHSDLGTVPLLATGEVDRVSVGEKTVEEIKGGVEMLQRVTATGCAQGAICAAFLGWGQTPGEACVSASKLMKMAGERAWKRGQTPGRFQMALLDELCELSGEFHD